MRTLPVALAYRDTSTMLTQSARLSAMTHYDPQAEVCCAVYNLWIKRLLRNQPLLSAWNAALAEVRRIEETWQTFADTPGMSPLPEGFVSKTHHLPNTRQNDAVTPPMTKKTHDCLTHHQSA